MVTIAYNSNIVNIIDIFNIINIVNIDCDMVKRLAR